MQTIKLTHDVFEKLNDCLYGDVEHEIDIVLYGGQHDLYPVLELQDWMNENGNLNRVGFAVDTSVNFFTDPVFMFDYGDSISIEVRHPDGHVIEI